MIGEKIKELRKQRGLTQKKLGELCEPKIAEPTIRKYELGILNPKIDTIKKIASALNVSPYDIMGYSYFDYKYPKMGEEVRLIEAVENLYGSGSGELLYYFEKLNPQGKAKAVDNLSDLAMIDKYRKN